MGVITRYLKLYLILLIIINLVGVSKLKEIDFCGDDDYMMPCVIQITLI